MTFMEIIEKYKVKEPTFNFAPFGIKGDGLGSMTFGNSGTTRNATNMDASPLKLSATFECECIPRS